MSIRQQAIIWANDGLAYWCMYASLGLNQLITCQTKLKHNYHLPPHPPHPVSVLVPNTSNRNNYDLPMLTMQESYITFNRKL